MPNRLAVRASQPPQCQITSAGNDGLLKTLEYSDTTDLGLMFDLSKLFVPENNSCKLTGCVLKEADCKTNFAETNSNASLDGLIIKGK